MPDHCSHSLYTQRIFAIRLISTLTVVHPDLISLYYNLKERKEEMRAHQMEKVLYISGFQGEG